MRGHLYGVSHTEWCSLLDIIAKEIPRAYGGELREAV